jgi:hypothetical protein
VNFLFPQKNNSNPAPLINSVGHDNSRDVARIESE